MNAFYSQNSATARIFAVLTMFAVLLSAFIAPFSGASAQEPASDAGTSSTITKELSDEEKAAALVQESLIEANLLTEIEDDSNVRLSITKIICEDETLLPNDGYTSIGKSTADDFLHENESCYEGTDWEFQYAFGSVDITTDNEGLLGSPWITTDVTGADGNVVIIISPDSTANNSIISVREVMKEGYLPFTGRSGGNVSAELYCASDAANYDNLEWIQGLEKGKTYHCVAWNVPVKPEPVTCEFTMVSDAQDLVVEKNAYAKILTNIHTNWVTSIPSSVAKWIWGDNPVNLPTTASTTQTFKKSFNWNGLTIDSAVLTLASDNSHDVTLGTFSSGVTGAGEFNYGATKNYNIATSAISTGVNMLTVEVENFPLAGSNASTNPAGLLYELKIKGTGTTKDCGQEVPLLPENPKFGDVTMCKVDGKGKVLPGWQLALVGEEIDSLAVAADGSTQSMSTVPVGEYVLKASGTYGYGNGGLISDARFSKRNPLEAVHTGPYVPWVNTNLFPGATQNYLSLQVNSDGAATWGSVYSPAHVYYGSLQQVVAGNVDFTILDNQYADNTGTIGVSLHNGRTGITNEDGCVTFKNVPYGDYNVEELLQEGWVNINGLGEVKVDSESEKFTITNRLIKEPEEPAPVCDSEVNLIKNGSFETPNIPEDGFGWDVYASITSGLEWVVNWLNPIDAPVPAKLELQSGFHSASKGVQYAELDSNWNPAPGGPYYDEDARVSIYQDIVTIPGRTYFVSYDFSALPGYGASTNILQVLLDGIEVAEHSANGVGQSDTVWSSYSYSFVATSTKSRVGFADAGLPDSFGTLIDNVSLNCRPNDGGDDGDEETITPNPDITNRSGGGGGGTRLNREVGPTPTVAGISDMGTGGDFVTPTGLVLGDQVSAVPYGAPGTGRGGSQSKGVFGWVVSFFADLLY